VAQFDLRLSGGRVVLPGVGVSEVDVLVTDGKTAGLCRPGTPVEATEVIDVSGLTVLPGAIDPHLHLGAAITFPKVPEDFTKESAAAAAGGVTTLMAFLMGAGPYEEPFAESVKLGEAYSLTDFGFHFCINTQEQLQSLPGYVRDLGVSSFKFFMSFRGEEGKYLGLPGNDDGFLYDLLLAVKETGSILCPHTENIEIVWRLRDRARALEAVPLRTWYESRPPLVEAEAMQRVAYLAGAVGAPIYAVHISCVEALNAAREQRRQHAGIYVETCPHYLTLDVDSAAGTLAKVNPPVRTSADREALWEALKSGEIDSIGSDHNHRTKDKKAGDIWKASAGFPGTETLLPLLVSEGHVKRGIPLDRIVEVTSTSTARIFGLYPRKGTIAVGSDADYAVIDLKAKHTIRAEELHSMAGYTPYEGREVSCRVVHTFVRGVPVVRNGVVQSKYGHGQYLPRPARGAL